jgi:glyoxylase I family protein
MKLHNLTPLLQVFDMPTSICFYRDLLGFTVVSQSGKTETDSDWAMLTLGTSTLMLNTAYERHERPQAPDPARVQAHMDTALFFGCENADQVYDHLRTKGWNAQPPKTAYYGMRQVFTKDPDGFELCFQHSVNSPGNKP